MLNSKSVRRVFGNIRWREVALALCLALLVFVPGIIAQAVSSANLFSDPQFESGVSGFAPQDQYGTVEHNTESPIAGGGSLRVISDGWGTAFWGGADFPGGRASRLQITAHLRSDQESGSNLRFCAAAYFEQGEPEFACTPIDGAAGDKGTVASDLVLDETRPLAWVGVGLFQEGSDALTFTLDDASAILDVVADPPPPTTGGGGSQGGGDSGSSGDNGNGGDGGGSANACTVSQNTVYPGFVYQLPAARPFISLSSYTQASATSTPYRRMQAAADAALDGQPPYAYSATHSVIVHALTSNPAYLADAIARVDGFVTEAEAAIANGHRPAISGDSYLDVGWFLEQLALTYDHGYASLTPSQRDRWAAFAEQSLFNLWNPNQAKWGDVSHPWSGWSICDPGNNYHFSFLRATMLWALASQNQTWLDFLQQQKFGPLLDYYAALPGGGTREGTGYGTALNNLFGNYILWKDSTGEDLANITAHPRETIDYWVHATVPTLDRFAPIADLSRQSVPELYDYQESLVHELVVLSQGTPQARRGAWWLQHNSVNGIAHTFSLASDLLPYPDAPAAPTDLVYHSPGAGALFARTSWDTDAAWLALVAGKYDQSHAHQDQGSFTFFKNDWLAVTNNIWSHSGIHQEVDVHNTLRFERADGSVIPQNQSSTVASSMTPSQSGGVTTVTADLKNAYSANANAIPSWTRTLELSESTLRVTDLCSVATGVRPIFQLQVPAQPVMQGDGSIRAGRLLIVLAQPATASFLPMNPVEFQKGYRIDLAQEGGCGFDVILQATEDAPPQENPGGGAGPDQDPPTDPSTSPAPTPAPTCVDCSPEAVEAVWSEVGPSATRIKSPAPHMHFTAGAPFRILADARDPNAWMCAPGHPPYVCPGTQVRFYVDGQLVAFATPSATDFNLWEARLPEGLSEGDHVLTVTYVPYNPATGTGGSPVQGLAPVTVHVDPPPSHSTTFTLTDDLVLSGSTDLTWTDTTVVGNGFSVTSAPGYSGHVVIQNALVTGLGDFGTLGVDVATTGSASIEGSIFEATGGMRVNVQGSAPLTIRNNELRANNLLTYVSSNPDVPVALELVGNTGGAKVVQGNRIGGGIFRIRGGSLWQIGGLADGEGNVLIGPRAVLEIVDSSNDLVQGNYLRHDYHGGFSQGFNLVMAGSSDHALIEHNVVRGGSWPVQSIGGEFRYNLVIDSGHNFWRSARDNAQVHHNVFANASAANTGYEGAVKVYGGESGLQVFNNTFDAGGSTGSFDSPAFNIGSGSLFQSVRNNLFTAFSTVTGFGGAFVSAPEGSVSAPRVTSADYNAWYNPLASGSTPYLAGIVANLPGGHDVHAHPQLSGPSETPYRMSEGCVWLGNCTTGQVLAHYREIYRPSAGSPLINAGDPADGAGTPIGAIGPDDSNPADRFGRTAQ